MRKELVLMKKLRKTAIILFWLGVWTVLALSVNNKILLVSPAETAEELLHLLRDGDFYVSVGRSLLRIGTGFVTGFAAAVLLAAGSRRFPFLEELLSPVMSLLKAIPVASFVVLLLIWWGSSFLAVAICFLVVLPNLYINTLEGLKNTDKKLLEMAQVFRLPFRNRFFYIYRPALKPFLYSGMKISLGMCWKSGVAAEVIGTPDFSIGERLYLSKIYLNTAGVFAWTAVIILLSVLFEKIIMRGTDAFFSWEPSCRKPDSEVKRSDTRRKAGNLGIWSEEKRREAEGKDDNSEKCPGEYKSKSVPGKYKSIVLTKVDKSFGEQKVLEKQTTVYEPGQIYYLRQPSGSGKTTLLRILAGLLKPDGGNVFVPGTVSMMFQEDRLCEEYSAIKNVELVCGDRQKAEDALAELLEKEALEKPCELLSGGMKRRVALVRAMEADSAVVLLDEPFAGMDAQTRARAESYIEARRNNRTLIIATHI